MIQVVNLRKKILTKFSLPQPVPLTNSNKVQNRAVITKLNMLAHEKDRVLASDHLLSQEF